MQVGLNEMKPNNLLCEIPNVGLRKLSTNLRKVLITPLCEAEHRRSVWIKHDECLSAATNLSGTNLDARGARRVSGKDATNQFPSCPTRLRSTGNPQGKHGLPFCLVRLFWASKINERPAAAIEFRDDSPDCWVSYLNPTNVLYVNVKLGFTSSAPTYRPYLIPSIASKNWPCFMDEVVECLSAASFRPRHKTRLILGIKAISGALFFGSFLLGKQKK
ncbi:hypothetical protein A9E74_00208 [Methylophaga muralis]|uniref:Uncharacterized protein n=1 Tax=Methylophaga muralis TaxID=291169 RepID=A0A1E3GXD5_9GAMM|nr:hypothetical protein A9E74_00208 [Methylophaga muralis]